MSRILRVGWLFLILVFLKEILALVFGVIRPDLMVYFGQFLIMALPVTVLAFFKKGSFREKFKLNKMKWSTLIYCFIIFIASYFVSSLISDLTTLTFGVNPFGIKAYLDELNVGFLTKLFMIAVTPALCEEWMFRGLLLDKKSTLNMHQLAMVNGLMFALFHVGYDQLFYTFSIGIILAYVTIVTNSIVPAIVIHYLNNGLSLIQLEFCNTLGTAELTSVSLILSFVGGVLGLIVLIITIKKLIVSYKYDDKVRVKNNYEDQILMESKAKIVLYIPLVLMVVYVVIINIGLKLLL